MGVSCDGSGAVWVRVVPGTEPAADEDAGLSAVATVVPPPGDDPAAVAEPDDADPVAAAPPALASPAVAPLGALADPPQAGPPAAPPVVGSVLVGGWVCALC